jgi:hypothetical protein
MAAAAKICHREGRWSLQGMTALVTGGTKGIGFVFLVSVSPCKINSNY